MNTSQIDRQYSTGLSRPNIEQALTAAGKDLQQLQPEDLEMLEDFHASGRIATIQLAELAGITADDHVLDAGSGIGGTARFLAHRYECRVTSIDATEEFCQTATWLNHLAGVDHQISVRQGDVTDLPLPPASFQVVISQHVQMNVADKAALYGQARRVLAPAGRLAIWDITAGSAGELDYPLPWADRPELSHLVTSAELRTTIEAAGFDIVVWNDLTDQTATLMEAFLSSPPGPLGLQNFVDNFTAKARNLTRALANGQLRAIQALARATTQRRQSPEA